MKEFFTLYPIAAWSLVSTMVALVVVVSLWDKIKWWWHNTMYSMPIFGKIARLSKDGNFDEETGWTKAERALCYDYKKFIKIQDEHDFNEKITYLTKAGDNGRSSMPLWLWILTVALVVVEALGFSYVLAGFTIPGASETVQQYGAIGIAFMLSVILVGFTHFAGHECYRSGLLKAARKEWIEDGKKFDFHLKDMPLAFPQNTDDAYPGYTQLSNRVGKLPTYAVTIVTAVLVVLIGVGATYVRGQVLEKQLTEQVTGQINEAKASIQASNDSMDMSSAKNVVPEIDAASNVEADIQAMQESAGYDRAGGWTTFIVLAIVFLALQFLGALFGYKWGFAGKNSKKAFRDIGKGRYSTYADVKAHYDEIADVAQSKLESLQQKIMDKNSHFGGKGIHLNKKFVEFLEESQKPVARPQKPAPANVAPGAPAPVAASPIPAAVAPTAVVQAPTSEQLTVPQILQHLEALGDKDAKKAYLATLPPALDAEVRKALKAKKEEDERIKQEEANRLKDARDAELEDLL